MNSEELSEAVCYMLECTMATLERARDLKRTTRGEVIRLESIIATGLLVCKKHDLIEAARRAKCDRVVQALCENGGSTMVSMQAYGGGLGGSDG